MDDFKEGMIMGSFSFTFLAHIKARTYNTFITNTKYWACLALTATSILMNLWLYLWIIFFPCEVVLFDFILIY